MKLDLASLSATLLDQAAAAVCINAVDGRKVACNAEFARLFGVDSVGIADVDDHQIFPGGAAAVLHGALADIAGSGEARRFELPVTIGGTIRRLHVVAFPLRDEAAAIFALGSIFTELGDFERPADSVMAGLAAVERTNAELRLALATMERLASTDRLTGAWNRRRFEDTAVIEMARADRYSHPLSLLMLDVDHFKQVNDRHGHVIGDQVLKTFVREIGGAIRKADAIARWGGEEFVVLAPNTRLAEALRLANNLRARIAAATFAEVGSLSTSIGVAEYQHDEGIEGWMSRVDRALYKAKNDGRNCVVADPLSVYGDRETR